MFRRRAIIGGNTLSSYPVASTIPSVGLSGTTGYGTTVTAPKKRFGFIRRFGLRRGKIYSSHEK
jgi:hypothetical protein